MARQNPLPEQVSAPSIDTTRRELTTEINTKLPIWVFCWGTGILATFFGAIMFCLYNQINIIKDNKIEDIKTRLTILETKYNSSFDSSQKFQEETRDRLNNLEKKSDSTQIIPKEKHF